MAQSFVQVYTGEGKGKTTAALGLVLRALGAGMRVCLVQFMKKLATSELQALEHFGDSVTVKRMGRSRFVPGNPAEADCRRAAEALAVSREALTGGTYCMVVMDEACVAADKGLISTEELVDVVKARPRNVELVLTGRHAPRALIEAADLVTEMKEIKHYYGRGVKARKGIEN
jgi:cob(I)alamin adenosyltransferase